jgi:2,5-diketo-D-gluconate reductase A
MMPAAPRTAIPDASQGDVEIPRLGFGTYRLSGEECSTAVEWAIQLGYRHLDTAQTYRNEVAVGEGMRRAGCARDTLFVTTKVWREQIGWGALQAAASQSLEQLGLDHFDLLLIHWPNADVPLAETVAALADVKRQGMTRAIGVSNFPSAMLLEAARLSPEPIAVNQVEYHPFLPQEAVLAAARSAGIAVTAYSPLAQGLVNDDPVLSAIGMEHGLTPAQVSLCWILQQGVGAIPKTGNRTRAAQNLATLEHTLSTDDMAAIHALSARGVRTVDLPFAPAWDSA